MIIRKLLAMTIKPTEEKTIENVLKRSLKHYLFDGYFGLCACVVNSLVYYGYSTNYYLGNIIKYVPEFTQENAILLFHGKEDSYWWPIGKWWPRYRFMKWLIKQYKNT